MRKIAVIGAGLSGLSAALKLLETGKCSVTIFDYQGIGGGASKVASGLMHPYPGKVGRRSQQATEALKATVQLLRQVELETGLSVVVSEGIVRLMEDAEQREAFVKHSYTYGDVEEIRAGVFLIRSGMTVHCCRYLTGLWQMIQKRGGELKGIKIESLSDLKEFDLIILAAGAGVVQFPECSHLPLRLVKGQVLTVTASGVQSEYSLIAQGYLALSETPGVFHLGSTYEKTFSSEEPDLECAQKTLMPKISQFFENETEILNCSSGVRVIRIGHYFPIVSQLNERCWVLTALGSRGLLYHAYMAEQLLQSLHK
jgi:glycine/D-amino acid oxidase-like deaminating enzyme